MGNSSSIKDTTYPSPENLDSNLVSLWRSNFDVLNGQWLTCGPRNGSLPRNQLQFLFDI